MSRSVLGLLREEGVIIVVVVESFKVLVVSAIVTLFNVTAYNYGFCNSGAVHFYEVLNRILNVLFNFVLQKVDVRIWFLVS